MDGSCIYGKSPWPWIMANEHLFITFHHDTKVLFSSFFINMDAEQVLFLSSLRLCLVYSYEMSLTLFTMTFPHHTIGYRKGLQKYRKLLCPRSGRDPEGRDILGRVSSE